MLITKRKVLVFNLDGKEHRLTEEDLVKMLNPDVSRALLSGAGGGEAGCDEPAAVLVRSILVACGEVRGGGARGNERPLFARIVSAGS